MNSKSTDISRKKSANRTQSCQPGQSTFCSLCEKITAPDELFAISFKTLLEKPELIEKIEQKHIKKTIDDIALNLAPSSKKVLSLN